MLAQGEYPLEGRKGPIGSRGVTAAGSQVTSFFQLQTHFEGAAREASFLVGC